MEGGNSVFQEIERDFLDRSLGSRLRNSSHGHLLTFYALLLLALFIVLQVTQLLSNLFSCLLIVWLCLSVTNNQ